MATTQAQQNAMKKAAAQAAQNAQYMRFSYPEWVSMDAQNGNTYTPGGNALNFLMPITEGGYLEKIIVRTSLSFTYTPGTGSATVNAAAPYASLGNFEVLFGNRQIITHPYALHLKKFLKGWTRTSSGQVLGNETTDIQSQLYSFPALASGANTWQFDTEIRLNDIHPQSVWGLLPVMGTGTRVQMNVNFPSSLTGADPLLNAIALTGNATITGVSGTVKVYGVVRTFKSFYTRNALAPDLTGLPTVQMITPNQLNPLTAGTPMYKRIDNPYEFSEFIFIVIDGQSSGTFCSASNVQLIEIDRAENSNSVLRKFDSNNSVANYYKHVREDLIGQDMPDGVFFLSAALENQVDPSTLGGDNYLNLTAGGFPAARYGFQVGTVSSTTITPRVVPFGTIINRSGIQLA